MSASKGVNGEAKAENGEMHWLAGGENDCTRIIRRCWAARKKFEYLEQLTENSGQPLISLLLPSQLDV